MPATEVGEVLRSIGRAGGGTRAMADRLCQLITERLPVEGAGLSLISASGPQGIVAATSGPAHEMEELQFSTGEGPCIDSLHTGRPVLHPDLLSTGTRRWPGFGPAALGLGIRAVFAFPLQIGAVRFGALDLYRSSAGSLDPAELARALIFADAATLLLLHHVEVGGDEDGDLEPLLDGFEVRSEVHQATGMLSVQLAVPIDEALIRLRAHAYASGRSVTEVAADVVARRLRFRDDDDSDVTTEPI